MYLPALLSTSDLKIEQTAPHQLFEEHDVSSDSHVLHTTADPNELQLVTSSTSVTVGAVSTSETLEIDEPKVVLLNDTFCLNYEAKDFA